MQYPSFEKHFRKKKIVSSTQISAPIRRNFKNLIESIVKYNNKLDKRDTTNVNNTSDIVHVKLESNNKIGTRCDYCFNKNTTLFHVACHHTLCINCIENPVENVAGCIECNSVNDILTIPDYSDFHFSYPKLTSQDISVVSQIQDLVPQSSGLHVNMCMHLQMSRYSQSSDMQSLQWSYGSSLLHNVPIHFVH